MSIVTKKALQYIHAPSTFYTLASGFKFVCLSKSKALLLKYLRRIVPKCAPRSMQLFLNFGSQAMIL